MDVETLLKELIEKGKKIIVLDSIRSTDELEYIRTLPEYSGVRLIHVSCDDHLRLKRLDY